MQQRPDIIDRFRTAWFEELGEELTREEAQNALHALTRLARLLQRRRGERSDTPNT